MPLPTPLPAHTGGKPIDVLILIPVFDDWEALGMLLPQLDETLGQSVYRVRLLVVDDASTETGSAEALRGPFESIRNISLLTLRRNLGHQRAIAVGLAYAEKHQQSDVVVVMDADGEDAPADVPRLVKRVLDNESTRIVFAERTRRSESGLFQLCYRLYQIVHLLLTGIRVRVGNFSAIPGRLVSRLVAVSEMWNHYAAAVFKSRIPYETIPTRRAPRLAGHSRMNFVGLVIHGLSALSVHGELIGVRLIVAATAAVGAIAVAAAGVFLSGPVAFALPAWTPLLSVVIVGLLFQLGFLAVIFVFIVLQARVNASFLPARDYQYFIESVERIADAASDSSSAAR